MVTTLDLCPHTSLCKEPTATFVRTPSLKTTKTSMPHTNTAQPICIGHTYTLLAQMRHSPAPPLDIPFGSLPVSAFPHRGVLSHTFVSRPAVSPASWCCLAKPGKPEPETVHLTASDWNSATCTCNQWFTGIPYAQQQDMRHNWARLVSVQ